MRRRASQAAGPIPSSNPVEASAPVEADDQLLQLGYQALAKFDRRLTRAIDETLAEEAAALLTTNQSGLMKFFNLNMREAREHMSVIAALKNPVELAAVLRHLHGRHADGHPRELRTELVSQYPDIERPVEHDVMPEMDGFTQSRETLADWLSILPTIYPYVRRRVQRDHFLGISCAVYSIPLYDRH